MKRYIGRWALTVSVALCLAAIAPQGAAAQSAATAAGTQVNGNYKATIGLGLLGGELGLVLAPAVGLSDAWAMALFPVLGAAGGAVGGYFAFDKGSAPAPALPLALFVGGVALVIPSVVLALSLAARDLDDDVRQARRGAGVGLVRVTPRETFLAAPGLALQRRGAQVALVSGSF